MLDVSRCTGLQDVTPLARVHALNLAGCHGMSRNTSKYNAFLLHDLTRCHGVFLALCFGQSCSTFIGRTCVQLRLLGSHKGTTRLVTCWYCDVVIPKLDASATSEVTCWYCAVVVPKLEVTC